VTRWLESHQGTAVDEVQSSEADGLDCYVNIIEKAVLHENLIKTKKQRVTAK
jgi:hypothetical protein